MLGLYPLPGEPDQAIVPTQDGYLYRVSLSDSFAPVPFGDLSGSVRVAAEEGLLGLAFSPDYANDGYLYLYYNLPPSSPAYKYRDVLSRFHFTNNTLDPDPQTILIDLDDSLLWHNGGQLAFGQAGMLYVSIGDEGWVGDPENNAQNKGLLWGKVLRLDVSGDGGYSIPPDNPFTCEPGTRHEIYAYGFRNPWRFSIDDVTGDIWADDVGQYSWEEVNRVVPGGNYGWRVMEGDTCYGVAPGSCTEPPGYVPPRHTYCHGGNDGCSLSETCAVIGGHVYRGSAIPELYGWYVFGDYCSGEVWALDPTLPSGAPVRLLNSAYAITSFARLPDGELAILTMDNAIYRLEKQP